MAETFVPLVAKPVPNGDSALLAIKVPPQGQTETKAVFEPLAEAGRAEQPAKTCGRPSVTLQRQGEVVSGIRIECGCGQVIELVCAY
jgi:hypothetical protein